MKILAPYISCVLDITDETLDGVSPLEQAVALGYSQIFIPCTKGYMKYHILRPGKNGKRRYISLPVDKVPGLVLADIQPAVEFLPAGKIPMDLFEVVKGFFRQVIQKKAEKSAWE